MPDDTTKRDASAELERAETELGVLQDQVRTRGISEDSAVVRRDRLEKEGSTVAKHPDPPEDARVTWTPTFDSVDTGDLSEDPATLLNQILEPGRPRLVSTGEIGSGGMGAIEEVVDIPLRRRLAMKIVHESLESARGDRLCRFVREARINAQLEHPNIVPVHEVGKTRGDRLFFTMKLVEGQSLNARLVEAGSPPYERSVLLDLLEIVIKVCDALAYAHSRGVIHCDLKPENIMVGDFGQVYLMDWGIARVFGKAPAEGGPDHECAFLGTPAFMPPEQARGQLKLLDERADVFGVGAVLYRLLTGRPPYTAGSMPIVVARAAICNYTPPSENVAVPAELERIVLRAMAEDPAARYPDVESLKLDLVRFQRGVGELPETHFPTGTIIMREGDPGDEVYFIVSGACEAFRIIQGRRVSLRIMGPGEAFGETALLSPGPRTASVEAVEDTVACIITEKVLKYEMETMKPWMRALVRTMADRFREREMKLSILPVTDPEDGAEGS